MTLLDYDVARILLAHNILIDPTKKEMFWLGLTHETRVFNFKFCNLKVRFDAQRQTTYVIVSKSNKEIPYEFTEKINNKFENDYYEYTPKFDYSSPSSNSKKKENEEPVLSRIYLYTLEQLQYVLLLLGRPPAQIYKKQTN